MPDKMFVSSALDVISSVVGSLRDKAVKLVLDSNLVSVVMGCMDDNDDCVRQSAFAVFGDLCQYCFEVVRPHSKSFTMLCVKHMNVECESSKRVRSRYPQVCNNAIWSLGEMTLRVGEEMTPYGEMILPLLISMNSQTRVSPGIKDNSTIAICRFCLVCPQVVAFVQQYFPSLCMNVAKLRDTEEKEQAAKGLCVIVRQAPGVLDEHFHNFVAMVASWWARRGCVRRRNTISNMEVGQMMLGVLNEFKGSKGAEWESFYNQRVDIRFRQILRNNFNFYYCVCCSSLRLLPKSMSLVCAVQLLLL